MSDISTLFKAPAPATRALIELLDHWENGPVPETWISQHAPDQTLVTVWANAPSAVWLFLVRSALGDRTAFIRSLAAAARVAIDLATEPVPTQTAALDAIDAWCRGELSREAAIAAADGNAEQTWKARGVSQLVASVVDHVVHAMRTADAADRPPDAHFIEGVLAALRMLVRGLAPTEDADAQLARWRDVSQRVTKRVVESAPPPTLEQLRAAIGAPGLRKLGAGILVRVTQS